MDCAEVGRARKIPQNVWDFYRPKIEELYQTKQLQGEDSVIAWMNQIHNFKASESQYAYQFKKWGLRKNLKRKLWQAAIDIVTDRERQGKRSKLVIDGISISEERLARERTRYEGLVARSCSAFTRAPSPKTSGMVVVYSPPPSPSARVHSCTMETTSFVTELQLHSSHSQHSMIEYSIPYQEDTFIFDFAPASAQSFSWMATLDWSLVTNFTKGNQDIIKRPSSLPMDYKALFYESKQISKTRVTTDTDTIFAQYLVSALLNDITPSSQTNLEDIHTWLRNLPQSAVLQFFKTLPAGHLDVLRERVFAAAIRANDEATVRSMLELGLDPVQAINIGGRGSKQPDFPLCRALKDTKFPIAKAIVLHLSRVESTPSLNNILGQVTAHHRLSKGGYTDLNSAPKWSELVRILLDAGAAPTVQCFALVGGDLKLARQILEANKEGVGGWIRADLLQNCFSSLNPRFSRNFLFPVYDSLTRLIFSYILQEKINDIPLNGPATGTALWTVFLSALEVRHTWAMGMILDAASRLGIELGYPDHDDITNAAILCAYRECNWILAHELRTSPRTRIPITARQRNVSIESSALAAKGISTVDEEDKSVEYENVNPDMENSCPEPGLSQAIKSAIETVRLTRDSNGVLHFDHLVPELTHLINRIQTEELEDSWDLIDHAEDAIALGYHPLVVALVVVLDREHVDHEVFFSLLERGNTAAISEILSKHQYCGRALRNARCDNNFDTLDDLIYRNQMLQDESIFPGGVLLQSGLNQQVALQMFSFYAIHTNDYVLLKWLFQTGLRTCEIYCTFDLNTRIVTSLFEYPSHGRFNGKTNDDEIGFHVPSLLAVAILHKNIYMVQFLLDQGVNSIDTFALMRSVSCNAGEVIVSMLLDAAGNKVVRQKHFGAAALRAAIYRKDYDMLRYLSTRVDVNGFGLLIIENDKVNLRDLPPLSALGEAILRRDLRASRILIENNVSLNGLVTFEDYEESGLQNSRGTLMQRASPLLAAIDTENLPMIRLLIENGASIDHPPRLGLLRTPLQRAAEIGNFDIVQYLLECGAPVDSVPCYSGGTPLQLASLGGYTGIASLLLEKGADPNHFPAKGAGRTALEAAAEWNHVDMMSLLVSWNVNFDLVVNGQTQYKRAVEFAKKRGQMASKRFVERLRAENWVDLSDLEAFKDSHESDGL
ncbi:hypothetical protein BKA66DRAFT_611164 [Pyrenochaeta sp. MPI-SDFR-AT-0127]|nr:hypothetical protein BKA66DRAFT_611164 [Pyrenochaeta sp. MPI-SDFR-AT-0127]